MNILPADLVDEIIQNCNILDIIKLSHINIFYNKEIKKIFLNKNKKTNIEYLGLNIINPLELIYINKKKLQLKRIKEYKNVYEKLLSRKIIDLYTLYRIYNNFLKLFKEIHILTKNEQIIQNYYTLVKTLIIINEKTCYLFCENGDYCKKQMIIASLLRIILLINPLNGNRQFQEEIRILFYNFIEKIIKEISKKTQINDKIFFIKFLKDYLFELNNNCIIISYVEIFEFKKFIKIKLKENKLDIYFEI